MPDSRMLVCICCHDEIEVFELPKQFIDPSKFTCVPCLDDRYWDLYPQCRAAARRRLIRKPIDPATMPIPF
jgi:hypothetical protein